ncbi:UNVERIFIED_CONTAM: hypothetical protein NCL1_28379 [Trichonephila clavipes]
MIVVCVARIRPFRQSRRRGGCRIGGPLLHLHYVRRGFAERVPLELGAHSAGQVRATGDVVEVLRLHFLLVRLAVVEVVEVGHNHRYGQGNGEHTSNGTQ